MVKTIQKDKRGLPVYSVFFERYIMNLETSMNKYKLICVAAFLLMYKWQYSIYTVLHLIFFV